MLHRTKPPDDVYTYYTTNLIIDILKDVITVCKKNDVIFDVKIISCHYDNRYLTLIYKSDLNIDDLSVKNIRIDLRCAYRNIFITSCKDRYHLDHLNFDYSGVSLTFEENIQVKLIYLDLLPVDLLWQMCRILYTYKDNSDYIRMWTYIHSIDGYHKGMCDYDTMVITKHMGDDIHCI